MSPAGGPPRAVGRYEVRHELGRGIEGESEKSTVGIELRKGHLTEALQVSPGTGGVRARLAWDDGLRRETATAQVTEAESRTLRVRLDRWTKGLSVEWR